MRRSGFSVLRSLLPWLGVGSILALVIQPLLGHPAQGHDTLLHFYRIPQMNALFARGVAFARWMPNLMLGYGYPLLNFYPPLSVYVLTLSYWVAGANAPLGLVLAFGATMALAVVGMFALARRLYGETGALLAAAAYGLSPTLLYHTLERGSLSNALAMALFPLVALAIMRMGEDPRPRRLAFAALLFGTVILSHAASSLAFAGPAAVLGLAACFTSGRERPGRRLFSLAIALGAGLGLAAFVWLPAIAELRFTQYSSAIASPDVNYSHFFADVFRWPSTAISGLSNPPLPVNIGLGQLVIGLAATALALVRLVARNGEREDWLTAVAGLAGLATLFLATPASSALWASVTVLRNFQFPWRWLDPAAFLLSLTCGWMVRRWNVRWQTSVICGALLLFFCNAVPYLYPPRWENLPSQPSLADASRAEVTWGIYGLTSWGEYAPATAHLRPTEPPRIGANLDATLAEKLRAESLPKGALLAATGTPWRADLAVRLDAAQVLTFESFYFPGWTATLDGQETALAPDAEGRLTMTVPSGQHDVTVAWTGTRLQALSGWLSAVAALCILLAFVWPTKRLQLSALSTVRPASLVPALAVAGMSAVLVLAKVFWLDQFDTPLVRHLHNGVLAGTSVPESGDFGGELRLVGYSLEPQGRLTLYWEALRSPAKDYTVRVALTDMRGVPYSVISQFNPGLSATSRWEPGQLVRDEYNLRLEQAPRPSAYQVVVSVSAPATVELLTLVDASAANVTGAFVGVAKLPPAPADVTAEVARFGNDVVLARVQMPDGVREGQRGTFTMLWKSVAPVSANYTVFVHILRADGSLAATADGQPCNGLYPTSVWSPGEIIEDTREWLVNVPPGDYRVVCGLYRLDTGERLGAAGPTAREGEVSLGSLTVLP